MFALYFIFGLQSHTTSFCCSTCPDFVPWQPFRLAGVPLDSIPVIIPLPPPSSLALPPFLLYFLSSSLSPALPPYLIISPPTPSLFVSLLYSLSCCALPCPPGL